MTGHKRASTKAIAADLETTSILENWVREHNLAILLHRIRRDAYNPPAIYLTGSGV